MVIFEINYTLIFTLNVISTVKNAITKHFTVFLYTGVKIDFVLFIQLSLWMQIRIISNQKKTNLHHKSKLDCGNRRIHLDNPTDRDMLKMSLGNICVVISRTIWASCKLPTAVKQATGIKAVRRTFEVNRFALANAPHFQVSVSEK